MVVRENCRAGLGGGDIKKKKGWGRGTEVIHWEKGDEWKFSRDEYCTRDREDSLGHCRNWEKSCSSETSLPVGVEHVSHGFSSYYVPSYQHGTCNILRGSGPPSQASLSAPFYNLWSPNTCLAQTCLLTSFIWGPECSCAGDLKDISI